MGGLPLATERPELPRKTILSDLADFSRQQLADLTMDPDYELLRYYQNNTAYFPNQREAQLWNTVLYFTYISVPSGCIASDICPTPEYVDELVNCQRAIPLTIGSNRRGIRSVDALERHLSAYRAKFREHGSLEAWLTRGFGTNRKRNWQILRETLEDVWGNGRWATWSVAEGLMVINGLPVIAPDMGMKGSTGPRWGLELLYNPVAGDGTYAVAELDSQADMLLYELATTHGVIMRIHELETALCEYHKMWCGKHYVGYFLDELQELLRKAARNRPTGDHRVLSNLWDARAGCFSRRWLGEWSGWYGLDHSLMTLYARTGKIGSR